MSNIKYISDHDLTYKEDILKELQAYNKSKTGERKKDTFFVYAYENDQLVGALHTEQGWDWVYLTKIYYKDVSVLKGLLNEVYKYYKSNVVGIQHASFDDNVINQFVACGFYVNGELPDHPKGKTFKDILITDLTTIDTNKEYQIITSRSVHEENNKLLDNLIQKDTVVQTNLEFIAMDDKKFAGGVYGYLKHNYLYVSLLVVSENYRGKQIATKLMDLIEKEAHNRGIDNIYLGTCEFQALGFYLKRKYHVTSTIKDFPKGFEEYTLVKKYEG